MKARRTSKPKPERPKPADASRDRNAVLEDFRRIAGPLRGRNRDQKPKA